MTCLIPAEPFMSCLLVLNAGSSSLRFALFTRSPGLGRALSGKLEYRDGGRTSARYRTGDAASDQPLQISDPSELWSWLEDKLEGRALDGAGHRIVHGGPRRFEPALLTRDVVDELRAYQSWSPEHLPAALDLVEAVRERWPALAQIGCFDTGFHRDLPAVAALLPIPRKYLERGVRRFGFHGLSYTWVSEQLERRLGGLPERCIFAHLGGGSSMAALRGGHCIDTTMAFTPNSGLPMSTRSGDLDVGLFEFLAQSEGLSASELGLLLGRDSGLLGVSGKSGDVRDLLAAPGDRHAREAIGVFCYAAKKQIGAYAAALGGLDLLAFSGGIGENVAEVRRQICSGLGGALGLELDEEHNRVAEPVISTKASSVAVHVVHTDEELVIAKQALALLEDGS